jgi:hypothetical protein
MTVRRLLAPAPWGEALTVDEFLQWKALEHARAEEQQEELGDGAASPAQSRKRVVTDSGEISRWFSTT